LSTPIVIFGNGGHAKVIADIARLSKDYEFSGFITKENQDSLSFKKGIIGVGDNYTRSKIAEDIIKQYPDFEFINLIHPRAIVADDIEFGVGNVIMAGATVNPGTRFSNHCIANTNCTIDHDCVLENYSSIAPGATLGGNVSLGEGSAVSLGANVIQGIKIGEHSVIGAGATVVNDIDKNIVAYGTPAKFVSNRLASDSYLS